MTDPLTGLLLTKAEYETLASTDQACEPSFPSWAEWNKFQIRAAGVVLKQGHMPPTQTIDVAAFRAWCALAGAAPCVNELRSYCATRAEH